jgi:hypothetical protein
MAGLTQSTADWGKRTPHADEMRLKVLPEAAQVNGILSAGIDDLEIRHARVGRTLLSDLSE